MGGSKRSGATRWTEGEMAGAKLLERAAPEAAGPDSVTRRSASAATSADWEVLAMRVACAAASCSRFLDRQEVDAALDEYANFLGGLLTLEAAKPFQDARVRASAFAKLWSEEERLRRLLGLGEARSLR